MNFRAARMSLSFRLVAVLSLLVFFGQNPVWSIQSDLYPDPKLTPGIVYDVTKADVCSRGYSRRTRKVSVEKKREVFRRYKVKYFPHAYEVDHFIPLCLGGSNDVKNLWPEPIEDALEKDKVEDFLCREVCSGRLELGTAQEEIRTDWKKVYDQQVPRGRRRNR